MCLFLEAEGFFLKMFKKHAYPSWTTDLWYQMLGGYTFHFRSWPISLFHFLVKLVSKVPVLVKVHRPGKDVHNSKIRGAQHGLHSYFRNYFCIIPSKAAFSYPLLEKTSGNFPYLAKACACPAVKLTAVPSSSSVGDPLKLQKGIFIKSNILDYI